MTEVMSEGLTLACGGLVVLYALAIPAFVEFDEAKINAVKYSVTFLDRNGNEIGKRGILHSDAVPLEEIDEPIGGRIVLRPRLAGHLLAHPRGDDAAERPLPQQRRVAGRGLRSPLAQDRLPGQPSQIQG